MPSPDPNEAAQPAAQAAQVRGRTRLTPTGKALALGCAVSVFVWAAVGWAVARYVLG